MARVLLPQLIAPPLNAHHEGVYDEQMIRWRAVCALDKARNVQALLGARATEIVNVIEVGTGTGAVILELARLGVGQQHVGADVADPSTHAHPGVLEAGIDLVRTPDGITPFPDASFDLVVASHVLEHVEDERGFLAEVARLTRRWIYIEVPCEITARMSTDRMQTALNIGHINAYTPETLALTVSTAGLRLIDAQVFDFSMDVYRFSDSTWRARAKAFLRQSLLKLSPIWASRIFCYHVGILCEVEINMPAAKGN